MPLIAAAVLAFILDLVFADPKRLPHLVTLIGAVVHGLERFLRRRFPADAGGEYFAGFALTALTAFFFYAATHFVMSAFAALHPLAGFVAATFICFQTLAARGLWDAAGLVRTALEKGDLGMARRALGRIVGRDTENLDLTGIVRGTVETVAENASDGVVAPLFYFALGGPPLAVLYKAVNTMDSMIGYKNARYRHFGFAAARLDDIANFIPARLTAFLMVPAALVCGFDWRNALAVLRRDGNKHTSPNAGRPEAACAGALGIRLGGGSFYSGVLTPKPFIGDNRKTPDAGDIGKACRLMYASSVLALAVCCLIIHLRMR